MTVLLALVLAQVAPVTPPAMVEPASPWPFTATWKDGAKERTVHLDESLVAERDGTEASASELRSHGAMVSRSKGRMKLWRVERASALLATSTNPLPVYRDEGSQKLRVPIGDVLVVPTKGVPPEKVKAAIGEGAIDQNGVIRVSCPARDVFSKTAALAQVAGVWWVQPDWWLGTVAK